MNRVAVLFAVVFAVVGACSPVGGRGSSCDDGPCAPGLVCTDEHVCADPPEPPEPPCDTVDDCALNGDASGRDCVDGVCGFLACTLDAQCGNRICVDGFCEGIQPCFTDGGCDDGDLCVDNACRPPCLQDEECGVAIGGIALQVCVEGVCLQRCLNDATCFGGGVCDNNVCVVAECNELFGCAGDNVECVDGRCEPFTPCETDEGCFDPNLRCDLETDPPRCVERPLCFNDAACGGGGICLDTHCRPVSGCLDTSDCLDVDDECVGGRCVNAPACRAAADCDAGQACDNLRCVVADELDDRLGIVADAAGVCAGCDRVLVVGESSVFTSQAYDVAGQPVLAAVNVISTDRAVAAATVDGNATIVDALAPGVAHVEFDNDVARVTVVEAAAVDEVVVLVVGADGGPVEGAVVTFAVSGAADVVGVSDVDGVARAVVAGVVDNIVARAADGRGVGVILAEAVAGTSWRLPLPDSLVVDSAAPVRVTVASTGDELGPVGLGLAVGTVARTSAVSLDALLGDDVTAALAVPIIGTLPVTVPSALSLTATLPLVGDQVVRAAAEVVVVGGPAFVLALEGRRDNDTLTSLALGGDLRAFALELFEQSETLDAQLAPLGNITALPLVVDADDRDGDGNTSEGVADFAAGLQTTISPSQGPSERSSVVVRLPDGISQAVVVAGFDLPGRFVPAGVGILRGLRNFEGLPLPESFKAVPSTAVLSRARRAVVVTADLDDDTQTSRLTVRGARLPALADLGALLAPPDGAFVVDDLPVPGARSVLVPEGIDEGDIDLVRLRVVDNVGVVDLYSARTGAVRLPSAMGSARLQRTTVLRAGGLRVLRTGDGPTHIDDVATALASADGG